MNELKCPKCGTVFKIDEGDYAALLNQVRNEEFNNQLKDREKSLVSEKESEIKALKAEIEMNHNNEISKLKEEITSLKNKLDSQKEKEDFDIENVKLKTESEYKEEITKLKLDISKLEGDLKLKESENEIKLEKLESDKNKEIDNLKNTITVNSKEYELKEKNLKENYDNQLKIKDETISFYKDLKARQSTKMIGETLEQHCNTEFSRIRPIFGKNTYFEKDNDASSGSKGDFIFRDYDEDGNEIVSIMFEMKNEADMTATKHKNEDFFKELDKDRKEKKCEYAVLVSLLEIDNETYNVGIVDVSYKYDKMYVIRPQFFVPLITMLRNASLKTVEYKKQLVQMKNTNIDITNFEDNLNKFKDGFSRNCRLASDRFAKAIAEIDKTIDYLNKTRDDLLASDRNLQLANSKLDDLSIKKITKNNPTMIALFDELKKDNEE